jgi:hypothetical protein
MHDSGTDFEPNEPQASRRVAPPGLALVALIVVSLGAIALATSTPWDTLALLPAGLSLWAGAGTVWLIKLGLAAFRDGLPAIRARWRRWLAPLAVGVLGFVVAVSGISFQARFELSRSALDEAASRADAGRLTPWNPMQLGLFSGELSACDTGGACFYMGDSGYDAYYFIQLPDGVQPANDDFSTWSHLGGRWWLEVVVTSR